MKKKLLVLAFVAVCLSILAYGSVAFFTAGDTARNVITAGDIGIELREWSDKEAGIPFPKEGESGVMPGTSADKLVEVANTGGNPAWVRVAVSSSIVLQEGVDIQADLSLISLDINTADWICSDGFYYYNRPLAPGEVTTPLFTAVSFDKAMSNDYQNSKAIVQVAVGAVQSANNGETALEASGWPDAE